MEASWAPLGPSCGRLGAVLEPSWAVLGPSWAVLGPSWAVLGPSWGRLGGLLGPPGALLEAPRADHSDFLADAKNHRKTIVLFDF